MVISTADTMFMTKPVFTMSFNCSLPLAKTMALGGVPIGSIPAQLAPNVMGMPNNYGLICKASEMPATTGANTITCAMLLMISLIKMETMVTVKTSSKILVPAKPAIQPVRKACKALLAYA